MSPSDRWSQSKRWWQQHKMTTVIKLSKRPMCEAHTLPPIEHIKLINPTCHIYLWHHMIYIGNIKCHYVPLRLIYQSMYIKWKKIVPVPFFMAKDQKIRLFAPTINRRVYGNYYSRPILKNAKYEKASRTLRNFHDVLDNVGEYWQMMIRHNMTSFWNDTGMQYMWLGVGVGRFSYSSLRNLARNQNLIQDLPTWINKFSLVWFFFVWLTHNSSGPLYYSIHLTVHRHSWIFYLWQKESHCK